jgi:hypothetical protein
LSLHAGVGVGCYGEFVAAESLELSDEVTPYVPGVGRRRVQYGWGTLGAVMWSRSYPEELPRRHELSPSDRSCSLPGGI